MTSTGGRTDHPLPGGGVIGGGHGKTPPQSFSIEALISSTTSTAESERRKAFSSVQLRRCVGAPLRPRTQLWTRGYPTDPFAPSACPKSFPGLPRPLPLAMGFGQMVQARHNPPQGGGPLRVPALASSFPSMAAPWSTYRSIYSTGKAEAFSNWIMSRPDVCMAPMLPVSSDPYLLSFRKPKRIRTAFSPHQLMELEQAFEKNHYLVGQERKDLASTLSLSETQVKVWFQNRRTKHKRVVPDEQTSSEFPLASISIEEEEEENEEKEEKDKEKEDKGLSAACCIPSGSFESTDDEFVDVDTFVTI